VNDSILHIKDLHIGYKYPVVSSINISADRGNLVCIIGRNGTGKSTLLNTLAGIIKPLAGNIFYENKDLSKLNLRERSTIISYVPSKQEYLSNLSVYDLVTLGRSPYTNIFDKRSLEDKIIIDNAIKDFDLEELRGKALYEISDGERQRSMICRAIVQETPVILLDEPTAFLDYYAKQKLLFDLAELANKKYKCIIFSSHDIELSLKYARIIWLFHNKEVVSVQVDDLKKSNLLKELMGYEFV
jgi:iron complex transport system ATP-binding protein